MAEEKALLAPRHSLNNKVGPTDDLYSINKSSEAHLGSNDLLSGIHQVQFACSISKAFADCHQFQRPTLKTYF